MALKLKYKDEHGILRIDMSPTSSPVRTEANQPGDLTDPKFDTINNRFGNYDLFGGKYEDGGGTPQSLFRSRYNSIEEELANTPYAFATDRSLRLAEPVLDITIQSRGYDVSPSKDIEDDRFFNRDTSLDYDLFGPEIDFKSTVKSSDGEDPPAFTVTQLIHAQDRYFDLSSRQSFHSPKTGKGKVRTLADSFEVRSAPSSAKRIDGNSVKCEGNDAFKVLSTERVKPFAQSASASLPVVPTLKKKREKSFAILAEPVASRPASPRSLPVDIRAGPGRVSPFKGRGFRDETSRHNTPKTSAANSRCNSPPRKRTSSLSRIDKMAQAATLPPPVLLSRPHSPKNFLKQNIEEIRELSELNREKNEAEAEKKRQEEEDALLREMGLLDKTTSKSRMGSRANSRSNSPSKINLRSRSNSPSALLRSENVPQSNKAAMKPEVRSSKQATHKSRVRSLSRSQPQSNDVSPKNSKIPKRQNSVSPARATRNSISYRRPFENNLNNNQRFISNSTSSIHETIKIGSQVHDKRAMSQSTQFLDVPPTSLQSRPPISPGRGGPPPSNRIINSKRLSPIVGTPNKSPVEDQKDSTNKTTPKPSSTTKRTTSNTLATSRSNVKPPNKSNLTSSKVNSATKTPSAPKTSTNRQNRTAASTSNLKSTQNPTLANKTEPKKQINRTSSMKSLTRTPSTKTLNEKPPLAKRGSKNNLSEKAKSTSKINELGTKTLSSTANKVKSPDVKSKTDNVINDNKTREGANQDDETKEGDEVTTQDNETQYDKITNDQGDLVILTKKNVVSMTTAAITAQPLEVVTTVTNQLPAALEKAREKGIFERLGSRDSLVTKEEAKENIEIKGDATSKTAISNNITPKETKIIKEDKNGKHEEKKPPKPIKTIYGDDNVKLKLLQPPYNNPQVEKVKQKIDSILKEPEISTENILSATKTIEEKKKEAKETLATTEKAVGKIENNLVDSKKEIENEVNAITEEIKKEEEKITANIRSEATKIVDSIITPVEEPKIVSEKLKSEIKKNIEPIVMVVNEKNKEINEKINETLVKGEPEIEVQSSNVSTPGGNHMEKQNKIVDGGTSATSATSNGGFPQSTSTTPKPPPRFQRQSKKENDETQPDDTEERNNHTPQEKKPNICSRLMGKCKTKCCSCCTKNNKEEEGSKEMEAKEEKKEGEIKGEVKDISKKGPGILSKLNCCKKKTVDKEKDAERGAGKVATIEFETETKRKRKLRDVICGCCRRQRVSDVAEAPRRLADVDVASPVVHETGCCGKKRQDVVRRDSILSDRTPSSCCNYRLCQWFRGACLRKSEHSSSPRASLFSKNKSLSPTLPPEDTRTKLDPSLVEHTSVMRGAIPVLPISLAYFCLFCNILVPGLGTIFSGMFCLCFGIPRFGIHDGLKYRLGSFVINLLVGCGQLFTVLFCLVGWGWSIWWGTIMIRISSKYRKLKAEAALEEAEGAPPITTNNHTRA